MYRRVSEARAVLLRIDQAAMRTDNQTGLVVGVTCVSTGVISAPPSCRKCFGRLGFAASVYGLVSGHRWEHLLPIGDEHHRCRRVDHLDHLKMPHRAHPSSSRALGRDSCTSCYLDVGESKSGSRDITIGGVTLPAAITTNAEFDLKSTFWTIAGKYRLRTDSDATCRLAGRRAPGRPEPESRLGIRRRLRSRPAAATHGEP